MNLLSTDNSFYRFCIDGPDDISESCFARRQVKARQNSKKSFFYDIQPGFPDIDLLLDFLESKVTPQDVLCAPPDFPFSRISAANNIMKITDRRQLDRLRAGPRPEFLLFSPRTKPDLTAMTAFYKSHPAPAEIFWMFSPYDPDLKSALTVKDICAAGIDYQTIPGLELFNRNIPSHYELEPQTRSSYRIEWRYRTAEFRPSVSVIIPTYNNAAFLSNVIWHLIRQNTAAEAYEIIVVDDGSTDGSGVLIEKLFEKFKDRVNLTYIYWSKQHPLLGSQDFFRPGLARNLASRYSSAEFLVFLDSDMLVPHDFIEICVRELRQNDIIQFQRFHIHQDLSKNNPRYRDITVSKDTYIEERNYWSQLFFCRRWPDLPYYWKYTCTYALGISRKNFLQLGMFKKYYISYGFEDTDLGYEAHKRNLSFALVKTPLLHLTSYDLMQYKNSASRRLKLLRVTAELFFLQHLNRDVYNVLGNFYRSQKPLRALVRDLLP